MNDETREKILEFDKQSKSGVGVHMFKFTRPSDNDTIYIASEVTDENSILDVKFSQWSKSFSFDDDAEKDDRRFKQQPSHLKVIWKPIYKFSSGRVAMVAVVALFHSGYEMSIVDAESRE